MDTDLSHIENTWHMLNENDDRQKENETPVRRSGRKSWFETTPRSARLEIAVEKKKRRSSGAGKRKSEEMETLLLTHFTNPPRIDFGKVKVSKSRTRHLVLKNPHDYEQEVVIEKFPFKKKFSVVETKYVVGPEESVVISITWCPEESGNCREMLLFKIDGLYRLQAFVLGMAESQKQARKGSQRKGLLGAKVKRPFSILHTPGLACIRDNYSPQEAAEKPKWRPSREPFASIPDEPNKYREEKAFSPPTMESTVISKPAGSEKPRAMKISDLGCSPSLLTSVSPIAHTSDENRLFDSYCTARPTSPPTEVCGDSKINESTKLCETGSKLVFETPAKQLVSNTKVEIKGVDTLGGDTENLDKHHFCNILQSKKYLSPETFLNDSLSFKSKQMDAEESPKLCVPVDDRFASVVVSPNSFLEDLNATKDELSSRCLSDIPSPASLLNDSIPHDVMLRQLSTVRTSLIGRNKGQDEFKLHSTENLKVNFHLSEPKLVTCFSLHRGHTGGKVRSLSKNMLRKEDRFVKISEVQSPRRTTYFVKKANSKPVKHMPAASSKTLSRTQNYTNIHKAGVKGRKKKLQSAGSMRENVQSAVSLVDDSPSAKTPTLNQLETVTKVKQSGTLNLSGLETVTKVKHSATLNLSGSETVTKVKHSTTLNLSGSETVTKIRSNGTSSLSGSDSIIKMMPLNLSGSETVTKVKHDNIKNCETCSKDVYNFSANNSCDTPVSSGEKSSKIKTLFTNTVGDGKFTSPHLYFSPLTNIGSPQLLPESPSVEVSKRTTLTVTESRSSDALLQVRNRTVNKQLFKEGRQMVIEQVCVKAVEETHVIALDSTAESPACYLETDTALCSGSTQYTSPAFISPSQALPSSPVIENNRRSTHVIPKPKVLNPNASPKRLFPSLSERDTSGLASFSPSIITNELESRLLQDHRASSGYKMSKFMESTRIDLNPDSVATPPCVSFIADDVAELGEVFVQNATSSHMNSLTDSGKTIKKYPENKDRRIKMKASRRSSESPSDTADKKTPPVFCAAASNPKPTKVLSATRDNQNNQKVSKLDAKKNKTAHFASESSANILDKSPSLLSSAPSNTQATKLLSTTQVIQNNQKASVLGFKKKKTDLKPFVPQGMKKRASSDDTYKVDNDHPSKLNKTESHSAEAVKKKGLLWRLTSGRKKPPVMAIAQPKLILVKKPKTGVPKHPMPFAAKNMYYDERWKDKQDRGFVKWLNFILTPSDEYNFAVNKTKVDIGSLSVTVNKDGVKRAPTKEVLSFRAYAARRRLNRLRRAACCFYQSKEIISVILKIEVEVEKLGLAVRKDKMLHADIGIKQRILDMLLCYNPLWLRVGLETVFGEVLPLQSNSDVVGMSRFILYRLVSSPDIASEFSHPTVPHLYRDGYAEAVAQHTLKKFLLVVFFLDRAKMSRLIDHDPCLFCKDADIKASKDLLVSFSRDYLSGEGDITRHLAYLGYTISHIQTALDEFDFSVTKLGVDLRDGFRLTRVLELLTGEWSLTKQLRGPAISKLQKMHNVSVVFKTLDQRGLNMSQLDGGKISSRDIVDGHREKTLKFLWHLIFHFQVDILINKEELTEEIKLLERSLRIKLSMQKLLHVNQDNTARRDSGGTDTCIENEKLSLLLQWCRVVCLHYGVKIENFTVSFSDGRALCCLVHHYHPSLLCVGEIHMETSQSYQQQLEELDTRTADADLSEADDLSFTELAVTDEPGMYEELLGNERKNFKLLYEKMSELGGVPLMLKSTDMSNTIPDEKVVITYVMYLCSRLLDIRHESRAARVIQIAWRRFAVRRALRVQQKEVNAAKTLQAAARLFLCRRKSRRETQAAVLIQSTWRRYQARRRMILLMMAKQNTEMFVAAVKIQAYLKGCVARRQYQRKTHAVTTLQAAFRGYRVRLDIKRKNTAATKLQNFYRGYLQTKIMRKRFDSLRKSTVTIQMAYRANLNKKYLKKLQATLRIQQYWKRFKCRRDFLNLRQAAVVAQKCSRMKKNRNDFLKLKKSTLMMQRQYRAKVTGVATRKEYLLIRAAVCKLQAHTRCKIERRKYLAMQRATVFIQKNFRRYKCEVRYRATRLATVIIQRRYRNYKLGVLKMQTEKERTAASVCIQRWWRKQTQMKVEKRQNAVLKLQSAWRGFRARKALRASQAAVVVLQSHVRRLIERRKFLRTIAAVIVLQHHVRTYLESKHLQADLLQRSSAAVTIQSLWKMKQQRRNYSRTYRAIVILQKFFAMLIARKRFLAQKRAAVVLQRHVCKYIFKKAEKMEKAKRYSAAVTVQSWWRMCHGVKTYSRMKQAAVLIQRQYRGHALRKQLETKRRAAVIIQQRFRALRSGRQVRKTVYLMNKAATVIQTKWRAAAAAGRYCLLKTSAITIQSHVRRWLAERNYRQIKTSVCLLQVRLRAHLKAKETRHWYVSTRNSLIRIQAAVRRLKCRREYVAQRRAAVVIQSYVRMHRQKRDYHKILAAVCVIQRRLRHHRSGVAVRDSYLARKRAVVCLQSHVKRTLQSRRYREERAAVLKLQSFMRMCKTRRDFHRLKTAAVFIQCQYRRNKLCRHERAAFLCRRDACLKLQVAVRQMLSQRRLKKNAAAKRIQSFIRGYRARKEFLKIKHSVIILQSYARMHQARIQYINKKNAAVVIQKRYRLFLQMWKVRQQFLAKQGAAITIQAVYRGYLVRKLIATLHEAAVQIQTAYRMHAARTSYVRLRSSALTIQKHYRSHRVGRQQRIQYLEQKHASGIIQRYCRGFLARSRLHRMQAAAVRIQSAYKSHRQRCYFVMLQSAVLVCQARYRARNLSRYQRRCFLIQVGAAVTIQASFRSYVARKRYLDICRKIQLLQASVRAYLQRKTYLKFLSAAKTIQAYFRAHQKAVEVRQEFVKVKSAAMIIRTAFRKWKEVQLQKREQAAMLILTWFRMQTERARFERSLRAVVCVQSVVRGFLSRCHYRRKLQAIRLLQRNIRVFALINIFQREILKRRTAARVIQTAYRQHRVKQDARRHAAAVSIQASVRCYLEMKRFCRIRQKIIFVQTVARCYLSRKTLTERRRQQKAAIILQRWFRAFLAIKTLKVLKEKRQAYLERFVRVVSLHVAATRIQRWYRRHLALVRAQQQLQSVIIIQRSVKSFLVRVRFIKLQNNVVLLQRQVRCWIRRRDQAARVIQRNVVKWLLLVKQKRLHQHAAKIQAVWKGYHVRNNTKSKKIAAARRRIEEANSSATEEKKLGNRTTSALDYLLRYQQLSYILEALIHLDVATRLSPRCCERMVEVNAVHVIYRLIQSCNRSLPHMELIKYAVNILLNLVKYHKTKPAVYSVEDAASILVELMAVYRDKGLIFSKTCTLLGILALDVNTRNDIARQEKVIEKIQAIHFLTSRKHGIEEMQRIRRAKIAAQKTFNCTLPLPTPSKRRHILPAWVLRRNSFECIHDPLMAINFVMENLHIKAKKV